MQNRKVKIVAIDDNADNLFTLKVLIREQFPNAIVLTALSGKEGLEIAEAEIPHLILLDILMPEMDGFEVCKKLKSNKILSDIPVVFVTALGAKKDRIKALNCGGEGFLSKPIDESELTAQIRAMLKIREATIQKVNEKEQLEALVAERTFELKKLSTAVEQSTNTIVITNTKGNITYTNPKFTEVTGYLAEEVLGRNPRVLNSGEQPKAYYAEMWKTIAAGKIWAGKFKNKAKNGDLFWEQVTISPIRNKNREITNYLAVKDNITELKKSEERLSQVINNSKDWIWEVDAKGLYTYSSNAVESILGYKPEDIVDKKYFFDFFHEENGEQLKEIALKLFKQNKAFNGFINKNIAKNGKHVWVSTSGSPILDEKGNLIGYRGSDRDITKRKENKLALLKAKKSVEASESKYKDLANTSHSLIWTCDIQGKFTYLNPAWEFTHGYKIEEMLGKTFSDFQRPEISERDMVEFTRHLAGGSVRNYETTHIIKGGAEISLVFNAIPLKDLAGNITGTQGTAFDITDRVKNEKLLEKGKLKLQQLNNNYKRNNQILEASQSTAKLGGWELDLLTKQLYWTAETYRIHDTSPEEFNPTVDAGVEYFLPESKQIITEALELAISQGENYDLILETYTTKGRKINVRTTAEVSFIDEKPIKLTGIFQDITEIKKNELELIKVKEEAQKSDKLKSAFLANMSHEIRTPMNGILGFSELLKNPELGFDKQARYINIIEKSGKRMLNIINDIVDISKIESGLMKVDIKKSNINGQLEYIYTFFKPEVEGKGMQLFMKNPLSAQEIAIYTDREKLFAILTNLVKNAIKYTDEGFIEIGYVLKMGEETINQSRNAELEFFIKDTGIGIPKGRQEAVFERFIQADIEDEMARQGAGLGLSITKAYVESLGGKIWMESVQGVGSTFYFTLPYNTEHEENNKTKSIKYVSRKENDVKKLKILIAEDDEASGILLSINVSEFSKEIFKARTGTEAIEICRNNPDIDLILMDVQMPVMNGYEATRQIRQFNKGVVIIAQTAYGLTGDKRKSLEAGCNDYITKPINRDKLHSLIHKYFKK